ncbi:glycosyltransferase family 2 protein [Actinoplanes sp. M2I2]|uniref:glycosyltransferase family 2 protein n=1 Tax=Actinoplanes sp. M2I2 TaxID=1734444 RepID=UPI002021A201|nr:glycosyltransferase family 2 protein [Actinoplanes sp. M2I2]
MNKLRARTVVAPPRSEASTRTTARVSVVIPTYNYGRFLPSSVGSVLAQEGVEVEVVVVDDCSTDDSRAVARELAHGDDRVIVVENPANHGPCAAFNDGLERATGEFVVRLDADDLLTPGSLARAVRVFDTFPDVGLVYGHPVHFHSDNPPAARTEATGWTVWAGEDWLAERCRTGVNCITTPEAVVRASVYAEVGPWDTRMRYACDMEAWMRVSAVADVARIEGADQALHREHSASLSVNAGSGRLLDLRERRVAFDAVFEGPGGKLAQATQLHERARRALATEALEACYHAYDRRLTGVEPIDEYVAFALETYPAARELKDWRRLEARRRLGPRLSPVVPTFFAWEVYRRLRNDANYRRWIERGV